MAKPSIQPHAWHLPITSVVAVSCLLGGCHGPLNDSNQLYGTLPLTGLEPKMPVQVTQSDAASLAGTSIAPLDRSAYTPIMVEIESAQVEHEPTYRSFEPIIPSSARARDTWPTPESALSYEVDNGAAALDGLIEPFRPAVELVLAPISVIVTPPFTIQFAPKSGAALQPTDQYPTPWRWVQPLEDSTERTQPRTNLENVPSVDLTDR